MGLPVGEDIYQEIIGDLAGKKDEGQNLTLR